MRNKVPIISANGRCFVAKACFPLLLLLSLACIAGQPTDPSQVQGSTAKSLGALLESLAATNAPHSEKWQAVLQIKAYGKQATPGVLKVLSHAPSETQKYYCIRALGYLGDPAATEALCNILTNRQFGGRRYAAMALGQIRDARAVPALQNALGDVDFVRADALDALVKIKSPEAIAALERYYFAKSDSRLLLSIACDKPVYAPGEGITLQAQLKNASKEGVLLAEGTQSQSSYLLFQRSDGEFLEEVNTGLREDRAVRAPPTLRKFNPGEVMDWKYTGTVETWSRGEKDDHSFVPAGEPFLTLNFKRRAYHIRRPGKCQVRIVFRQSTREISFLKSAGLPEEQLKSVWTGSVVSGPVTFTIQ